MKKTAAIPMLALVAGCLSSAPKAPTTWNIDADTDFPVSAVTVCAPFDGQRLALMRPDGSVAFDSFNSFAARPAALVRASTRVTPSAPELIVRRLALDCTREGERKALVELALAASDQPVARASASVDAADGNYTRAFTEAFVRAIGQFKSKR